MRLIRTRASGRRRGAARRWYRRPAFAVSVAALAAAVGAGVSSTPVAGASVTGITVYAASSLTDVFPAIDPGPKYSFAGSNTLAGQITLGAPADVFASANTTIPAQLYRQGARRAAGQFHPQHARDRRAEGQPGEHPFDLRPHQAGGHDRHRELWRSRWLLHVAGPGADEPHQAGAGQRRQPGDRRPRRCSPRWRSARSTPGSSTPPTPRRFPARSP